MFKGACGLCSASGEGEWEEEEAHEESWGEPCWLSSSSESPSEDVSSSM